MGFIWEGVQDMIYSDVKELFDSINKVLDITINITQNNDTKWRIKSLEWFGDGSPAWQKELLAKVKSLKSIINTKEIKISFSSLSTRDQYEYGAASMPTGGWTDYSSLKNPMTQAQKRNFRIALNTAWQRAPKYRIPTNMDSKFQTLVHEFTHLILDTDDHVYTAHGCHELVRQGKILLAKKNADSWGYFVEEFQG